MFRIRAERVIHKDIEQVFAVLTDHESYKQFRSVQHSELLQPGHTHKNGVGALRALTSGKVALVERINIYEPPNRIGYHIESTNLPMRHDMAEIAFEPISTPSGDATRVVWTLEGHITIPVLGSMVFDRLVEKRMNKALHNVLAMVEQMP